MKHDKYIEMIGLSLAGELSEPDQARLDRHLEGCTACRMEWEDWTRFYTALSEAKKEPSEPLLQEVRQQFFRRIDYDKAESARNNQRFGRWFEGLQWRQWATTATALAIGLLIGYLAAAGGQDPTPVDLDQLAKGELSIRNVRFLEDSGDETLDLSFDVVRPIRLSGSLEDRRIQQILTYALVTGQNPGVRLRAAELITAQSAADPDPEIETALLTALKTDDNPAVRERALQALSKRPPSDKIVGGFLYVLANDSNSKLRIEAINALEKSMHSNVTLDQRFIRKLQEEIETESNPYIRLRGHTLIEKAELTQ